ncbi:MAG: DUF6261 family protein [Tannerellaceae bacterium]|jgi:hypothetical protein|nr:DUF6261 family protein [Tannerellaceae bacterium]
MKVLKINLSNLHNEEWFGIHTDWKDQVSHFGEVVLDIKELFYLYLPLLDKADKVLLVLRKSVFTEDMKRSDKERKKIFKSFLRVAKDSINLSDAAKKEAARRLFNLLEQYEQYGVKGSYSEESSGIYNLLQDLSGKYSADVTLLGLTEWVKSLRQAEDKFLAFRAQRIQETIDKPKASLIELRIQIDRLYLAMVSILDAKLLADGLGGDIVVDPGDLDTGTWEDNDPTPPEFRGNIVYNFVVAWNVFVQKYHNLLAARAGRLARKKQPDVPSPEPPVEEDPSPDFPPEDPGTEDFF